VLQNVTDNETSTIHLVIQIFIASMEGMIMSPCILEAKKYV